MSLIDMEQVARELCPNAWKRLSEESERKAIRQSIIKVLQARFEEMPEEIVKKIDTINSKEALDILLKGAATEQTLEDFQKFL